MKPIWLNPQEYPFDSHTLTTHDGARMHYIDEGTGDVLLFVHGTPSWSFDYRHLIKGLRKRYRCIAMDHIGFGLSDKPRDYDYSLRRHTDNLTLLAEHLNLQQITLVVHDFGGPIGLAMGMQHPDRIANIVVLNSWLWSAAGEPEFEKLAKVLKSPLVPFLYLHLNVSPCFVLPKSFGDQPLNKRIKQHYCKALGSRSERYGALAFARSLVHDQPYFQRLWEQRHALAHKPMLVVWGMKDPVIPSRYAQRFQEGFPLARVVRLPTCGHFPQEEQAEQVLAALSVFLDTGMGPT